MTDSTNTISLRTAAFVAGLAILIMAVIAPFAELFVYPKLVVAGNPMVTAKNIMANKTLFVSAIFSYLITFIGDVVVSWALYVLLKPVNKYLSLLTAWFRLLFTAIALVSLLNLVSVFRLLTASEYSTVFQPAQLYAQAMLLVNAFRYGFHFGLLFFSIHLALLGYLVLKSTYIPKIMGVVLIISGMGYLTDSLKPFLFPDFNSGFITVTFFGELVFMVWLIIKGSKIKEPA